MKYFLLTVFAVCGAMNADVWAKNRINPTEVKAVAPVVDDTELDLDQAFADNLQAIVTAANGMKNELYMDFINECTYSEMILGLVSNYTKRDLDGRGNLRNTEVSRKIQTLSAQVNSLITEAQDLRSICGDNNGGGPNGKCCKKSAKADESDVCNTATNKNCKLTGTSIKGCSATSDDC